MAELSTSQPPAAKKQKQSCYFDKKWIQEQSLYIITKALTLYHNVYYDFNEWEWSNTNECGQK